MLLLRNARAGSPAVRFRSALRAGLAATALVALAGPAEAQILAMTRAPGADPVELEAKAWDLVQREGKYRKAARTYIEAATLRGETDPVAIENMRLAANLYFFSGDESKAQSIMLKAGEAALAIGDVEGAANRFLDAAWVAVDRGDARFAIQTSQRARLLMASPLLDGDTRREVLERIRISPDAEQQIIAAGR